MQSIEYIALYHFVTSHIIHCITTCFFTLSFFSLLFFFLCFTFHSHFNSFATIAFHTTICISNRVGKRHINVITFNLWPYERISCLTKEFMALWKNSWPCEIICRLTKELAALWNNLWPYKRIYDLVLSICDRSGPSLWLGPFYNLALQFMHVNLHLYAFTLVHCALFYYFARLFSKRIFTTWLNLFLNKTERKEYWSFTFNENLWIIGPEAYFSILSRILLLFKYFYNKNQKKRNIEVPHSIKTSNNQPRGSCVRFSDYSFFHSKTFNSNLDKKERWSLAFHESLEQSSPRHTSFSYQMFFVRKSIS